MAASYEQRRGRFLLSDDRARLDVGAIHAFLSKGAYWCLGIPRRVLETAIAHSLCLGLFDGEKQVGFTRVVTDAATFAWLCDVYVVAEHRGQGMGEWMIACVLAHPDLQGLRRIVLATRDAHELYRKSGFEALTTPERLDGHRESRRLRESSRSHRRRMTGHKETINAKGSDCAASIERRRSNAHVRDSRRSTKRFSARAGR